MKKFHYDPQSVSPQRATLALPHAHEAGSTHLETSGVPPGKPNRKNHLGHCDPDIACSFTPGSRAAFEARLQKRHFSVGVTRHKARLSTVISAFYNRAGSPLFPMVIMPLFTRIGPGPQFRSDRFRVVYARVQLFAAYLGSKCC